MELLSQNWNQACSVTYLAYCKTANLMAIARINAGLWSLLNTEYTFAGNSDKIRKVFFNQYTQRSSLYCVIAPRSLTEPASVRIATAQTLPAMTKPQS